MAYVLGCDIGTSYFKVSLVDRHGSCVGSGRVKTPKRQEQTEVLTRPCEFWQAMRTCFGQAVNESGIDPGEIEAISYASQANSFLLADRNDEPLTDLYLWPSIFFQEPDPAILELRSRDDFLEVTGIGTAGRGGLAAILHWFKKNRKELIDRSSRVMTISDYLLFGMTGNSFADTSTSSLLGMLDVRRQCWWDPALEAIGFDKEFFSQPASPLTFAGKTLESSFGTTGLPGGIKVYVGGLDHMVAALGGGIGCLAESSESTGTVLASVGLHDTFCPRANTCVGDYAMPGMYANLAFESPGAEVIEWYRDTYLPGMSIDDMLDLALEVQPGCNAVRYEPNSGKLSFSLDSGSADHPVFIRAICEYLSQRIGGLLERVSAGKDIGSVLAAGKANQSSALRSIMANTIEKCVVTSSQAEPGAFGAAIIAAVGCGWFSSIEEAQGLWIREDSVVRN